MANQEEPYSNDLDELLAKVRRWYQEDHEGFRTMYDATVKHVVPYPADTPERVQCDWKDQNVDFLCTFLTEWYNSQPGLHEGLDYIEKFSWINYENDYGMVFVTSGPGRKILADFTHLQGLQMDSPESKVLIKKWRDQLGRHMEDFQEPEGGWKNFNEFFARELKDPSRRPIDARTDKSVVVAPADCVINMIVDDLTENTPIPVKTVTMNVRQLLDDSDYAQRFIGGTAVSCILMPDGYHWYHTPVAGEVVEARDLVPGVYYGMRDFPELLNKGNVGYGYDYEMFDDFRRGYLVYRTDYLDANGRKAGEGYVGQVIVGLNSIASVNFEEKFRGSLDEPVKVDKGERVGNFMYGGSLNILLFEKNRFPALQLLQGQRIGVLEQVERTEGLFTGLYHTPSRRRRPLAP
ncbi:MULTISPECIES: phosphatidylserine decarboxylase [unclassified Kitasatospora]|uniref:phosphatidylserine decarboxylase n=1 Tax=unclassified Kitasatospora TaxID=2633591 RepID=UPI003425B0F9